MFIVVQPKNLKVSNELNVRVMRRVRLVYYTRKVLNPVVIECFSLFALTMVTAKFVSVTKVVRNSPAMGALAASSQFWGEAWRAAELPAQGLFVAILFLTVMLAIQGGKRIRIIFQSRLGVGKIDSLLVQKGVKL